MGIALQARHLKRHADIAALLFKYGRSELVRHAGLEEALVADQPALTPANGPPPEQLAADLERLGPTFVKVGQFLSSRPDLLPLAYVEALSRLQDEVEPFPFADAERIIEAELGMPPRKLFREIDPVPVASASLGQVHRAVLHDGRPVAVKVQRPGVGELVAEDLDAMGVIAAFLDAHTEAGRRHDFEAVLRKFRASLLRELDYRIEARNLATLKANLARFERLVVPAPVGTFTSHRVLTMDWVTGRKISAVGALARVEIDGRALAGELFSAYLQQILVDGFFHADPHPGNVFLTDDGRIGLIDLGMVARIPPRMQDHLLHLVVAISDGEGEEAVEAALEIGTRLPWFDRERCSERIIELVSWQQGTTVEDMQFGRTVLEVGRLAGDCGLRVPPDLMLLGKALLNLDRVGRILDPSFSPNEAVRHQSAELWSRRAWRSMSPGQFLSTALDLRDFLRALPARTGRIMDALSNNELTVRVDAIDEDRLISGLQAIANRITMGLVLASLVVGAALLMRVETQFRILGYPGLAMILFLAAVAGGAAQVLEILIHDRKRKK